MSNERASLSDGHHTFDELYEHRNLLFLNFMGCLGGLSWISRAHADGSVRDGWFIAGIDLVHGQVSYHLPERLWELAQIVADKEYARAPWDGHTANDVLERLRKEIEDWK